MKEILKKLWPLLPGIALFIGASILIQSNLDTVRALLGSGSPGVSITLFVLLGIVTVVVPFGSILPFLPIAVALWGWQATALLTLLAWVIGSQVLFLASRTFVRPYIKKIIPRSQLETMKELVQGKSFIHGILVRMFVHSDIVSYAFGLFTTVRPWEFLALTAIGVAPGAVIYAFAGGLPLMYQVAMIVMGLTVLVLFWTLEKKRPDLLRAWHLAM